MQNLSQTQVGLFEPTAMANGNLLCVSFAPNLSLAYPNQPIMAMMLYQCHPATTHRACPALDPRSLSGRNNVAGKDIIFNTHHHKLSMYLSDASSPTSNAHCRKYNASNDINNKNCSIGMTVVWPFSLASLR
jgi:hypothetical protein